MRALLIGANSYAGRRVADYFEEKMDLTGSYHNNPNPKLKKQIRLDMGDLDEVSRTLAEIRPDVMVIPAGISSTKAKKEDAFSVNAKGTSNIIEAAKKACPDSKIIYFSTDSVFDGVRGWYSESDRPNPINDYGRSKLAAEGFVREHPNHVIMRLPLILGPSGPDDNHGNFITRFISADDTGDKMKVFSDAYRTMIYVNDIPRIIEKIVEKDFIGTINVSSGPFLSYQDMARNINQYIRPKKAFDLVKCDDPSIPKKLGLKNDNLIREIGYEPLNFDQIVRKTFKEMNIRIEWSVLR
jgi:dTDP-4-dehydrorhamnose reductase